LLCIIKFDASDSEKADEVLRGTVTEHAPYQRSTFYSFDPMYVKRSMLEAVVVTHT